ncbi:MAG: quinolinate synthase NadA [Dehalococcoidia bacterium]|nr:quinolinate synthase NadA [Dehalococcoidia bacterium]
MTPGKRLDIIERPEQELASLRAQILDLKARMQAVIVAHNYQHPEVQDIADFVGDSLELSRKSTQIEARVIVFCGVHFMAETAAILNPDKTVYLAHGTAGCPMADMIDARELRAWKAKYPRAAVVCYVNTTAEVKAESDICCTSANAVKVVESIPQEEVLFVPDENLGRFVAARTNKKLTMHYYPGYCVTHTRLSAEQVKLAHSLHPGSPVVVHPECKPEVAALADAVLSTSQMIRYCHDNPATSFLIGTEMGILHRMRKEIPDKEFFIVSNSLICPNMKKTTLESILDTMHSRRNVVVVPEEVRVKAKRAVDRMLEIV